MPLQTRALSAVSFKRLFIASCPQCGETPIAPLAAGFVGDGHIRHVWSCDRCNRVFGSSVEFESAEPGATDDMSRSP